MWVGHEGPNATSSLFLDRQVLAYQYLGFVFFGAFPQFVGQFTSPFFLVVDEVLRYNRFPRPWLRARRLSSAMIRMAQI